MFGFFYFQLLPWPWKPTFSEQSNELFLCFYSFLHDLLKLHFITRCLCVHHYWWRERGKTQCFKYFLKEFCLNLRRIFWKFKQSWLSITWVLKKLNSIQTFVEDIPKIKLDISLVSEQNLHIKYLKLSLSWTNFVFYPNTVESL